VTGFRQIQPSQVKKGDVGYMDKKQHHFIVREVHSNGTIDTVEGNSGLTSTITTKNRPMSDARWYFTAF
jgi:hypothetical protein